MSSSTVALLTDYGHEDCYVGALEAVIHSTWPFARVLHLCHSVPPQNVLSGAFLLASVADVLPRGTVVCAVVDPGVGGERRAIAVECERLILIGPDNGLFEMLLAEHPALRAFELSDPRFHRPRVSATFHGRDVFAPAAAHVARGASLERIGVEVPVASLVRLGDLEPEQTASGWRAPILHVDHFGNLVTAMTRKLCHSTSPRVRIGEAMLPLGRSFVDVAPGEALAYFGSSDRLEVAVRDGSASAFFSLGQRAFVEVVD